MESPHKPHMQECVCVYIYIFHFKMPYFYRLKFPDFSEEVFNHISNYLIFKD